MNIEMTRREALKNAALATAALVVCGPLSEALAADVALAEGGVFKLPPLPYRADALEPFIDAQTMTLHHDKHHAAYVEKLNKAVAGMAQVSKDKPLSVQTLLLHPELHPELVPEEKRNDVRNQGGGHFNHTLWWEQLRKNEGGKPSGKLAAEMEKAFGGFEGFQKQFAEAGTKVFGSGWVWLVKSGGQLKIIAKPNQDAPIADGATPLLGLDVWEHAYYLKYQNRRADYIAAFWNVIAWEVVEKRFEA